LSALVLAVVTLVAACAPAPPPSSPASSDIVERHNHLRGLSGLGPFSVDGGMQGNAQFHADRLAASVQSCAQPLWHSGELGAWYGGFFAGENVACVPGCPGDGKAIFDMWWNSPPHQANIVNPRYTVLGVATQCNGNVMIAVAHYRSG
jgi:uncharacterized protein YkwD